MGVPFQRCEHLAEAVDPIWLSSGSHKRCHIWRGKLIVVQASLGCGKTKLPQLDTSHGVTAFHHLRDSIACCLCQRSLQLLHSSSQWHHDVIVGVAIQGWHHALLPDQIYLLLREVHPVLTGHDLLHELLNGPRVLCRLLFELGDSTAQQLELRLLRIRCTPPCRRRKAKGRRWRVLERGQRLGQEASHAGVVGSGSRGCCIRMVRESWLFQRQGCCHQGCHCPWGKSKL
mmetsp:Transcript_25040/g.63934  ORF Transcript_25040/g.63934 Transcript_25040/m.63934 type:complete len:230 (+) Transcript_25040:724-1413(+)